MDDGHYEDCLICYEMRTDIRPCPRCVHRWCATCHPRLQACPFCRLELVQPRIEAYEVQLELEFETDEWMGWF